MKNGIEQGATLPVNTSLPCGIRETVKHVEEHWSNVARIGPILRYERVLLV